MPVLYVIWRKLSYTCISFLFPGLSKAAMNRRYGPLQLCLNTLAWSAIGLVWFEVKAFNWCATLFVCHFMSRALATHHEPLNEPLTWLECCEFCFWKRSSAFFFFDALHNPWQQSNAEAFSLPSRPSRATRPQFNQFEWHSGVTRGSVPLFSFLFYTAITT